MEPFIEQLRAQRAHIQKHLDWIDRKLAEAEGDEQPTAAQSKRTPVSSTPAPKPTAPAKPPINPPVALTTEPDSEEFATAPIQGDIKKAKIGCLLFFVFATGLFLFLLFGLPYLLD